MNIPKHQHSKANLGPSTKPGFRRNCCERSLLTRQSVNPGFSTLATGQQRRPSLKQKSREKYSSGLNRTLTNDKHKKSPSNAWFDGLHFKLPRQDLNLRQTD